jgi:peptide chain release factor 1
MIMWYPYIFRLYQMQYDEQQAQLQRTRKQQTGSGNRNEKIRTYNIPQNRIRDERLHDNIHHVSEFLDGTHRLHTLIEQLKQQNRFQRLAELTHKSSS